MPRFETVENLTAPLSRDFDFFSRPAGGGARFEVDLRLSVCEASLILWPLMVIEPILTGQDHCDRMRFRTTLTTLLTTEGMDATDFR